MSSSSSSSASFSASAAAKPRAIISTRYPRTDPQDAIDAPGMSVDNGPTRISAASVSRTTPMLDLNTPIDGLHHSHLVTNSASVSGASAPLSDSSNSPYIGSMSLGSLSDERFHAIPPFQAPASSMRYAFEVPPSPPVIAPILLHRSTSSPVTSVPSSSLDTTRNAAAVVPLITTFPPQSLLPPSQVTILQQHPQSLTLEITSPISSSPSPIDGDTALIGSFSPPTSDSLNTSMIHSPFQSPGGTGAGLRYSLATHTNNQPIVHRHIDSVVTTVFTPVGEKGRMFDEREGSVWIEDYGGSAEKVKEELIAQSNSSRPTSTRSITTSSHIKSSSHSFSPSKTTTTTSSTSTNTKPQRSSSSISSFFSNLFGTDKKGSKKKKKDKKEKSPKKDKSTGQSTEKSSNHSSSVSISSSTSLSASPLQSPSDSPSHSPSPSPSFRYLPPAGTSSSSQRTSPASNTTNLQRKLTLSGVGAGTSSTNLSAIASSTASSTPTSPPPSLPPSTSTTTTMTTSVPKDPSSGNTAGAFDDAIPCTFIPIPENVSTVYALPAASFSSTQHRHVDVSSSNTSSASVSHPRDIWLRCLNPNEIRSKFAEGMYQKLLRGGFDEPDDEGDDENKTGEAGEKEEEYVYNDDGTIAVTTASLITTSSSPSATASAASTISTSPSPFIYTSPFSNKIRRDLTRTYPSLPLFQSTYGKSVLYNILSAYACYDFSVGYSQGLAFLGGMIMIQLGEPKGVVAGMKTVAAASGSSPMSSSPSSAAASSSTYLSSLTPQLLSSEYEQTLFWCLVTLMHSRKHNLRWIYTDDCTGLKLLLKVFNEALKELEPELHAHFVKEGIEVSLFATQWFLCIYSYRFPLNFSTNVWEHFLHHGLPYLLQLGLMILKYLKISLLNKTFDTIIPFLTSNLPELPEDLPQRAWREVELGQEMKWKLEQQDWSVASFKNQKK